MLQAEGIPTETFVLASDPHRPNVVARLKGNGKKRPLLLMGHTDVVNVDPKKWTFPPFAATRDGGYVYGRGAVDDKDNVVASLMVMLMLKRQNVPLDRDVIFLAESGEEGSTRVGIAFMANEHFGAIDAEYCLAEGGNVTRSGGKVQFASVQTLEKLPYNVQLTARGPAGHGSVPLKSNAIAHLSAAVAKVAEWRPEIRLNETTSAYFKRLAEISPPDQAARYRAVLNPKTAAAADEYFLEHEPRHASMLRTSVSPNIINAGYRINVIPSEASANFDVRALPDEQMPAIPRSDPQGRERPDRRSLARRALLAPVRRDDAHRLGGVQDDRGRREDPLPGADAADDEHGRDGHGVPAREGHPVLRHRAGHRHRGRSEGLRRAQRSGAHPRKRAAPLRALLP